MTAAVAIEVTALMERLRKRGATKVLLLFDTDVDPHGASDAPAVVCASLEVHYGEQLRISDLMELPAARDGMALEDNRLVTMAFQRLEDEVAPRKE